MIKVYNANTDTLLFSHRNWVRVNTFLKQMDTKYGEAFRARVQITNDEASPHSQTTPQA